MSEASEGLNTLATRQFVWNKMARTPVLGRRWKQSAMTTAYVTCSISLGLNIPGQFNVKLRTSERPWEALERSDSVKHGMYDRQQSRTMKITM
jgi:hypothetical protein